MRVKKKSRRIYLKMSKNRGEDVSLKERLGVPDQMECTLQLETGGNSEFSADILFPDAASAGLYELEAVELTTDYMKEVCNAFFDNGNYEILWPSYIYTQTELEKQYETVSEEVNAWTEDSYQSSFLNMDCEDLAGRIHGYKEEWETFQVEEPGNAPVLYPSPIQEEAYGYDMIDGERYEHHEGQLENIYDIYKYVMAEGKLDGRTARFNFIQDTVDGHYYIRLDFDRDVRDRYEEYTVQEAELYKKAFVYTEEEAAGMAQEYVTTLGLTEMGLVHTSYLMFQDHETNSEGFGNAGTLSAYRFTFGLYKNGVPMISHSEHNYDGTVTVDIGPEGLEGMYVRSPYLVVSTLTDSTELMTYEQFVEAAKPQIEENPPYFLEPVIEFGYLVVNYEGGDALVPVWRYGEIDPSGDIDTITLISAVDGERIDDTDLHDVESTTYHGW